MGLSQKIEDALTEGLGIGEPETGRGNIPVIARKITDAVIEFIQEQTFTISGIFTVSDASTARFKTTIKNAMNHGGLKGGSDPYDSYIRFKKLG